MARLNKLFLVLGKKGSGKTYYTLHNVIEPYLKGFPSKKILVYNTDDHMDYRDVPEVEISELERWTGAGLYRVCSRETVDFFHAVNQHVWNGLLICEDASKYITKNMQKSVWNSILDSKQHNLDIVMQFHGFAACPPEVLRQADCITMFKCDNPVYRRGDLVEYDRVAEAWQQVMTSRQPWPHRTVQLT